MIILRNLLFFPDASDHLIFGNRSFTYVALGQFQAALEDAKVAIKLKPDWPKVRLCNVKLSAGFFLFKKWFKKSNKSMFSVLNLQYLELM